MSSRDNARKLVCEIKQKKKTFCKSVKHMTTSILSAEPISRFEAQTNWISKIPRKVYVWMRWIGFLSMWRWAQAWSFQYCCIHLSFWHSFHPYHSRALLLSLCVCDGVIHTHAVQWVCVLKWRVVCVPPQSDDSARTFCYICWRRIRQIHLVDVQDRNDSDLDKNTTSLYLYTQHTNWSF